MRIWQAFGLQPHRQATFKLSGDPLFVEKIRDIVALYLNPPERTVVLCVDEQSQILALDRTAPILPLLPGTPERATHDFTSATARPASTPRWTSPPARCTLATARSSSNSSCRRSTARSPRHLDVHVVLDNSSTHKTPAIKRLLAAHPRFVLHFTPTSSSWLKPRRALVRRAHEQAARDAHRSVRTLNADIRAWIEAWNEDPRPFVWTKTADQILESIARYCNRINQSGR